LIYNHLQSNVQYLKDLYRITAIVKVETDIISSITASPTDEMLMLVILLLRPSKPMLDDKRCSVFDITQTDNFSITRVG